MTLVDQLMTILGQPDILPADPADAIMGPELLELVREKLNGRYEDSSIRQTFSALAKDPASPIARSAAGFGYYRRPSAETETEIDEPRGASEPPKVTSEPESGARDSQREEKFRALVVRLARLQNRFPVHVEHTTAARQPAGVNRWKFPDLLVLDWDAAKGTEEGVVLDSAILEVKRSLGEQPFRLSSIELKVEMHLGTFREFFFQCVSNSRWAHSATLAIATSVTDSLLADELKRLGTSYGVNVTSYNMKVEDLDSLPNAADLLKVQDTQIGEIAKRVSPQVLASGSTRAELDWAHLRDMMDQHATFNDLFEWIARCLRDGVPYSFEKFRQLRAIEASPA